MRCEHCNKIIWPWQSKTPGFALHNVSNIVTVVNTSDMAHLACYQQACDQYWYDAYKDIPDRVLTTGTSMGKTEQAIDWPSRCRHQVDMTRISLCMVSRSGMP